MNFTNEQFKSMHKKSEVGRNAANLSDGETMGASAVINETKTGGKSETNVQTIDMSEGKLKGL